MPKLSIITVTYQAERYIEKTLQSISEQTYQDFEFILVDGESTDKTLDIAKEYASRIDKIIIEKDEGLYDAMNKGLENASGDFVWFINAGDYLTSKDLIAQLVPYLTDTTDVVYSDTYFVNKEGVVRGLRSVLTPHKLPEKLTWQSMEKGMLVCHQSFIARRSIAPHYLLSNLSADLDWEIIVLKQSKKNVFFPVPLSYYLEGGISNQNLKRSLLDRCEVLVKHFGIFRTLKNHLLILLRGAAKIIKEKKVYW